MARRATNPPQGPRVLIHGLVHEVQWRLAFLSVQEYINEGHSAEPSDDVTYEWWVPGGSIWVLFVHKRRNTIHVKPQEKFDD